MAFQDHFSERATQYASARPTYPPALSAFLASTVAHPAVVWEAGCGSGQLTRDVAQHFRRVIATDPSYAQISNAPPLANTSYHCAIAEANALDDLSVDICVAAQAAHWFDIERYYAEVRRVCRAHGVVALISYGGTRINPDIERVMQNFHRNVVGKYWPPERKHVDSDYETLPFPFEPIPAPDLRIELEWSLEQLQAYVRTWSAVKALQQTEGDAKLLHFFEELTAAWGEIPVRTVSWPIAMKIGRVQTFQEMHPS